jgi:dTMP kinase
MDNKFITIEGGEGAGKSTQLRLLKERFLELFPGTEACFTREPGGSPFAEELRSVIFSEGAKQLSGKGMFGLFAAARQDHIERVIRPALDAGKAVICDRFAAATYAYQACAMKNPISEEFFKRYYEELDATPVVTIILDIDPSIGARRIASRNGQDLNHFDERGPEFHEAVRDGYRRFAEFAPACVINAEPSPEEVYARIVECLEKYL